MKLSRWLEDTGHGLDERLILVAHLLEALRVFHENEPGARPALDPGSVEIDDEECRIEPAPRALNPATASYRAPETNEGAPYAPSADTFSMGVLCYEVLSGRHPFLVETSKGTLEALTNLPATPLRDVNPEVPRDLADALMACLERDPEWRAKDLSYLGEVAQRLRPAKAARGPARKPAATPAPARNNAAGAVARSGSLSSLQPTPKPPGSRLPLLIGAVVGMLALTGGVWWLTRPVTPPLETPRPRVTPPPTEQPTTLPTLAPSSEAATPTPAATPSSTPTPGATPTPLSTPSSVATPSPTPRPVATEAAPTPTPRPVATPTPAIVSTPVPTPPPATTVAAPATPAALSALVPGKVKKGARALVDVRGSGLRPDHRVQVLRAGALAPGIVVAGQRYVDPGLVRLILDIGDAATPGSYQVLLVDANGQATNVRALEVTK